MKSTGLILVVCFLSATSTVAIAAATSETAAAAKAKSAGVAARAAADSANADADAAEAAAIKAAEVAAKAAAAAKAASEAKKAKAHEAVVKAQEKEAAAKKAIEAAAKSGAKSCDEWKQERAGKTKNGPAATWFSGFLSGIEVARNQDFLSGTTNQSLNSSVDQYCEDHPYEFISDAGIHIYLEMARAKGLVP